MVPIHNDSSEVQIIEHGERIAQMMILPVINTVLEEVNSLEDSSRGAEGFGDSGKF